MAPYARVIVTGYNQVDYLRRSLRGYLRQTTKDFRLVVADDGSSDGTGELLVRFAAEAAASGFQVDHVWHEDRGFRKTLILNEAMRLPGSEPLLIFSDGDCIPPARFVERHIEVHEPRSFHVGGAYRLTREVSEGLTEEDVDAGAYEKLGTDEDRRKLRKWGRMSRWGTLLRRPRRPKILGLNMAVDRPIFEAINGFDERFDSRTKGEDSDLRNRLMRSSPRPRVKVLYTRNDVYHLWHPENPGLSDENRAYWRAPRPVRAEVGLVQTP